MRMICIIDTRPWWQKILKPLDWLPILAEVRDAAKKNGVVVLNGLRVEVVTVET